MLTRLTEFLRGKLTHTSLDGEFNNAQSYINRLTMANPLNRDLDFNSFLALNLRATKAFEVRDASEFSTIAEAIADLGANTPGIIWLPPDRIFLEPATVNVPADVTIMGAGWGSVVQPNSTAVAPLFTMNDRSQLLDFKIDGNSLITSANPAISIATPNVLVHNLWISNWGNSGTGLATLRPAINCRDSQAGGVRILRNYITGCQGSGIVCGTTSAYSSDFTQMIAHNIIAAPGVHGIDVGVSQNVKLIHNQISAAGYSGIFVDMDPNALGPFATTNLDISYNQILDVGNDAGTLYAANGITVDMSTAVANSVRICHNEIYDVARAGHATGHGKGIFCYTITGVTATHTGLMILGNAVQLATEDGIRVEQTFPTNSFHGVAIDRNTVINFSTDLGVWDGIVVRNNTNGGIMQEIAIRDNIVGRTSSTYADGIDITDAGSNNVMTGIVTGNVVFGTSTGRQIRLSQVEQVVLGPNGVAFSNVLVQ